MPCERRCWAWWKTNRIIAFWNAKVVRMQIAIELERKRNCSFLSVQCLLHFLSIPLFPLSFSPNIQCFVVLDEYFWKSHRKIWWTCALKDSAESLNVGIGLFSPQIGCNQMRRKIAGEKEKNKKKMWKTTAVLVEWKCNQSFKVVMNIVYCWLEEYSTTIVFSIS